MSLPPLSSPGFSLHRLILWRIQRKTVKNTLILTPAWMIKSTPNSLPPIELSKSTCFLLHAAYGCWPPPYSLARGRTLLRRSRAKYLTQNACEEIALITIYSFPKASADRWEFFLYMSHFSHSYIILSLFPLSPPPLPAPPHADSRFQPWHSGLGTRLTGSSYSWGSNSHFCSWLSPYLWIPQWLFFLHLGSSYAYPLWKKTHVIST